MVLDLPKSAAADRGLADLKFGTQNARSLVVREELPRFEDKEIEILRNMLVIAAARFLNSNAEAPGLRARAAPAVRDICDSHNHFVRACLGRDSHENHRLRIRPRQLNHRPVVGGDRVAEFADLDDGGSVNMERRDSVYLVSSACKGDVADLLWDMPHLQHHEASVLGRMAMEAQGKAVSLDMSHLVVRADLLLNENGST